MLPPDENVAVQTSHGLAAAPLSPLAALRVLSVLLTVRGAAPFAVPLAAPFAVPLTLFLMAPLTGRRALSATLSGGMRGLTLSLCSLNSTESTNACQLASTTLLERPTVPQRRWPSVDSINTRTRAPVPAPLSRTRTL